jgi:hypothetical protein
MKKTNKAKVFAVTLSLIIILALSATAFAEGPKGSPQMDRMQSGQQMNAPQDGMQMNGPQGGFPTDRQPGDFSQGMPNAAPQGSFGENGGQQPPEKPEGEEPPVDGQQPPEKPEAEEGQSLPSNSQQPPEKPEGAAQTAGQQLSEDDQDLFQLFRQFLEWLKGNKEK